MNALAAIARGERPAALLQTCRLATEAGEAYGIEAVSAHFRAAPLTVGETIDGGATIAAIAGDTMLFADAYEGNVARLWRVSSDGPVAREPRVDVAFDPDLAQAPGDLFVSSSDFPGIPSAAIERIARAARAALAGDEFGPVASRRRLFLLRVASVGDRHAALFAHHALALGERVDAAFRYAALAIAEGETRWFVGSAIPSDWTPRV